MTAQAHEILILDGEDTSMMTCPRLPKNHPRLIREFNHGWARRNVTRSTACWRKYIGTWEIRNDTFFLRSVIGAYLLRGDEPLKADWYSGTLRVPRGERIQYVHMGFGSVYEEELYIRIRRGRVVTRNLRNRTQGHHVLKSLSNFPLIEKFLGEDSILAVVIFRRANALQIGILSLLFAIVFAFYLVTHVPFVAAIFHWITLLSITLIVLVLMISVYFRLRRWLKEKKKPKQLTREEWEQSWIDWRKERNRELANQGVEKPNVPRTRTASSRNDFLRDLLARHQREASSPRDPAEELTTDNTDITDRRACITNPHRRDSPDT